MNFTRIENIILALVLSLSFSVSAVAKSVVSLGDNYVLVYEGATRLKSGNNGSSRVTYSSGPIAVDTSRNRVFIAGHSQHFSVGEFELLPPVKSDDLEELPIAPITQPFVQISPVFKQDDTSDVITGLEIIDGKLYVATNEYYDANTNNKENLVIFPVVGDIGNSMQQGYYAFTSRSHASGWMSPVPEPLSNELGAMYISGSTNNIPVNSRHSIGPSMFGWFPYYLPTPSASDYEIVTTPYIDFDIYSPIYGNFEDEQEQKKVWNQLSRARYGFISPSQKEYIIIGSTGGLSSEIGYKITQDNGFLCGGYCAYEHDDYYNYYWIYSIEDVLKVQKGTLQPSAVKPIKYGPLPIESFNHLLIGADFDPATNKLFLLIDKVDPLQSQYESAPILQTYQLKELCDIDGDASEPPPNPEPIQCIIKPNGQRYCF